MLTIHSVLLIAGITAVITGGIAIWLNALQPMFHESSTFVLHPRDGHPMVCSSGMRIHFNWDGDPLMITPGDLPPGVHVTEFKRIRELTSTVQLADTTIEVDGDVIATALGPTVPDGWRRCMAVTVGKGRNERIRHRGGGDQAYTEVEYWWNECYVDLLDYATGELLSSSLLIDANKASSIISNPENPRYYLAYVESVSAYNETESSFALREYMSVENIFLQLLASEIRSTPSSIYRYATTFETLYSDSTIYTGPEGAVVIAQYRTPGLSALAFADTQGNRAASYDFNLYGFNKMGLRRIQEAIVSFDHQVKLIVLWCISMGAGMILALAWQFLLPRRAG